MSRRDHNLGEPEAFTRRSAPGTPDRDAKSSDVVDTLDSIERLLAVAQGIDLSTDNSAGKLIDSMAHALIGMRSHVQESDRRLQQLTQSTEKMAAAQAKAIVYSAEIIDELERTKLSLAAARSAAEEAASDNRRLSDTVFERTSDAVLVFEGKKCVACNDNSIKLLKYERDKLLGGWPETFASAKFECSESAQERLLQCFQDVEGQAAQQIEVQLLDGANDPFWAEISFSRFSMKRCQHTLAVVRDITSRKQFEAELRRHRDFLNNIISAVPDQLCVLSQDHQLVLANDAFCKSLSLEKENVIGKDVQQLGIPSYASELSSEIVEIPKNGSSKATSNTFTDSIGDTRVVSTAHSAFTDSTSGENYFIAMSRDITDERLREERLQLLASVFEGASEGVAILTSNGNIREANPAFVSMSACPDESPLGLKFVDALQVSIADFETIVRDVGKGTPWSGKASVESNGELTRSVWISLSPSYDKGSVRGQIIALVSDITELESSQIELHRRAMHDSLTGLPNRVYYRERLAIRTEQATEDNGVTICFLDLDDFKHTNDSLGHACGDHLLQLVGDRIRAIMGPDIFVSRFGGDEFALIIEDRHFPHAEQFSLLDDLLTAFRAPFEIDRNIVSVGLSIGVSRCPTDSRDTGTLMRNADIAMYEAKSSGKHSVREYCPEMQDNVNLRHRVQSKLRDALSDGEIELYFQPKIASDTYELVGCEALARWRTTDGSFIPPSDFVPIAERTGMIIALGDLVFEMAAENACRWEGSSVPPKIAVNVSPNQLRHHRFISDLKNTLKRTGAKAEWFELEITENAVMEDVDLAIQVIDQLVEMGFQVAIDDFGTGYSSLSYLKSFKIDTLKIDLSFTRDVTVDRQSEAIVRSIVSLGSGLNLSVVAEGVETAEQAEVLQTMGCTTLQGYFIGRPMAEDDYLAWAHQWNNNRRESLRQSAIPSSSILVQQ